MLIRYVVATFFEAGGSPRSEDGEEAFHLIEKVFSEGETGGDVQVSFGVVMTMTLGATVVFFHFAP